MRFYPDKGYEPLWQLNLDVSLPPDSPERRRVLELFAELERFEKPDNMDVYAK